MMAPALFHAQMHRWSMFCTLTFAGRVPAPALALSLQRRWLDRVAPKILRENPASLGWLSREELGETNGRLHIHLLLGEIRDASRVNTKTCLALMDQWEKVTLKALGMAAMARCRVFEPALEGVRYVLKGLEGVDDWSLRGANTYELSKFNSDESGRTVRLARPLLRVWGMEKGNKYALQARDVRDGHVVKCEL